MWSFQRKSTVLDIEYHRFSIDYLISSMASVSFIVDKMGKIFSRKSTKSDGSWKLKSEILKNFLFHTTQRLTAKMTSTIL
jgi:hypothetical protein